MSEPMRFACPWCGTGLEGPRDELRCSPCGRTWPVVDGVPHFVSDDKYWGEIEKEELERINRRIRTEPWRKVLLEHDDPAVIRAAVMMTNLDRANWHLLVPLPRESTVLDIGAGSGAVSHALALAYDRVVAIEPVRERIEFMSHRFRQEGLDNVTLVRGGAERLPLPAESVDLAVLNGVLEWIPWSVTEGDPREVQLEALRGIRRVLKPNGFLCIGIENRWTLDLLRGAKDPHADIPWVAVLPRPLANRLCLRKTGQPYRSYLYSAGGYRRLAKNAGFSEVSVYCALPSYNYPRFIVPLDGAVFGYYRDHFGADQVSSLRGLAQRALRLLGVDMYMVYSFFVIAKK